MIQLAHVATGALAGRHRAGALDALLAGITTHAVMDVAPHGEVNDEYFELFSGAAGVLALAARYGWRSPVTMGAIGAIIPDMEHLTQHVGLHKRALFPTHRYGSTHGWATKPS